MLPRINLTILLNSILILSIIICPIACNKQPPTHHPSNQTTLQPSTDSIPSLKQSLDQLYRDYSSSNQTNTSSGLDSLINHFCSSIKNDSVKQPDSIISRINVFVYDTLQIMFDENRENPASLFPQSIIITKKGSCVGISLLYLLIAERLNLPLYGVLVPGHFFIRYDDGQTTINIESLKRGASRDNNWYHEKFFYPDSTDLYLHNLSINQTMAVVQYNLGNIYRNKPDYASAKKAYYSCVTTLPLFSEAWGNLAITYDAISQPDSALRCFEKALELPNKNAPLYYNTAVLYLKQGNKTKAQQLLAKALELKPDFTAARSLLTPLLH